MVLRLGDPVAQAYFESKADTRLIAYGRLVLRGNPSFQSCAGALHRSTTGYVGDIPASVVSCIATNLRMGDYPDHMRRCPVYYLHRFDAALGFIIESRIVGAEPALTS